EDVVAAVAVPVETLRQPAEARCAAWVDAAGVVVLDEPVVLEERRLVLLEASRGDVARLYRRGVVARDAEFDLGGEEAARHQDAHHDHNAEGGDERDAAVAL